MKREDAFESQKRTGRFFGFPKASKTGERTCGRQAPLRGLAVRLVCRSRESMFIPFSSGDGPMNDDALPPRRPGGQMAARPLHFIWLADGSGSMRVDGKIQALNNAIREAIPHMQ